MEKKKTVSIVILSVILSIILILVVVFFIWRTALTEACSLGSVEKISQAQLDSLMAGVCGEFLPAPFFTQFWIFLKNLFNPITWDLIF